MRHYDGATDKPHMGFANSPHIRQLDKGRLDRAATKGSSKPTIKTCVKYKDSKGLTRYKGTTSLKGTELPGCASEYVETFDIQNTALTNPKIYI